MERPEWATDWGRDASGFYADLMVSEVVQRLRHMEPGTFWMGSPESEAGRDSDEGPSHLVTLTEGFWLADTACTQALWQAVMGDNPSHFKGDPNLPVDSVSWDDARRFLDKLNPLLPAGCEAVLPTEAQWEYACRAGTQTPYWFGESLSEEQAHVGQPWDKGRTVPVKARPANGWGLYQMHGNVWEWCEGSRREYKAEPVENPPDGQDRNSRALRGGSWIRVAGFARSAYRRGFPRVRGIQLYGFRFSLRSIKPSQGQVKDSGGAAVKRARGKKSRP
jgi:formylglycine-generating enzyme required for sulfatase activity